MKKLVMLALMVVATATAFAQEDVVKQIMKSKDYNEASTLLNANLNSMNSEQKAQCYNRLVSLSMETVSKEAQSETPSDEFFNALYNAFENAQLCEQFDQQPNAKGKIKPRFHNTNRDRLFPLRWQLINAGINGQKNNDNKTALKFFGTYVNTGIAQLSPLFADADNSADNNLTNISYWAGYHAFLDGQYDVANLYSDIALNDPELGKEALLVKLAVAEKTLKNRQDSISYCDELEKIYAADNSNELVFATLSSFYNSLGMTDKMEKIFEDKLKTDPNNFTVWVNRGENAEEKENLEEAINCYKKALVSQPNNAAVLRQIGICLYNRAAGTEERVSGKTGRAPKAALEQILPVYEEARTYLEKAKELDPQQKEVKWGYALYRCYYRLYGIDDERTKQAELDSHSK